MEYDFDELVKELRHVESQLKVCKTNEERVFVNMYLMQVAKAVMGAASAEVNGLTAQCVERVAPRVS